MRRDVVRALSLLMFSLSAMVASPTTPSSADSDRDAEQHRHGDDHGGHQSRAVKFRAPAGDLPTTKEIFIDGLRAAILPNGRFVTPAGVEVKLDAPKPFGLALSPDGETLATINSGAFPFSVTLIRNLESPAPTTQRVNIDATFMGVVFSADSKHYYASGGENGNIWVGETGPGRIVGSVNLNGPQHPLDRPLKTDAPPVQRFKGAFPGNMALSSGGFLYVVDQGGFKVHVRSEEGRGGNER